MSSLFSDLLTLLPELVILVTASVVLILDLYLDEHQRGRNHDLTLVGLVLALVAVLLVGGGAPDLLLSGASVRDVLSDVLKSAILVVALFGFVYGREYLAERGMAGGEYHVLVLFAVLGMLVMVSANGFLTLYLGLELLALSFYALVAFERDSRAGAEAGMKYFVLGAMGSGLLLYGVSMLYGATGSFAFAAVGTVVAEQGADNVILVFGLVFVLIGVAFKFGAVPFHMWLPDVYQGAPTPVVVFLASAAKVAAFAMAVRILIDALGALQTDWGEILVILAVLSMGLGNVVAIAQQNIKRMLAYSTISHVGFIFLGLLAGTPQGYVASMFYALAYAAMAAGGFGVLVLLSRPGAEVENLEDLKGLAERDGWLAAMMALLMFSMAGVPPLVGFMAKLLVLDAVVQQGYVWLAVVAVTFSIVGAFYYLRVVKLMYFDPPAEATPIRSSGDARMAISLNGLAMLGFGMFPAGLLSLCQAAFRT